jgi:hypothetical protein
VRSVSYDRSPAVLQNVQQIMLRTLLFYSAPSVTFLSDYVTAKPIVEHTNEVDIVHDATVTVY